MSWITYKLPEKMDKEILEVLDLTTYTSKAHFVQEAVREKIQKTYEENERKQKITVLLNEKGDVEEISQ